MLKTNGLRAVFLTLLLFFSAPSAKANMTEYFWEPAEHSECIASMEQGVIVDKRQYDPNGEYQFVLHISDKGFMYRYQIHTTAQYHQCLRMNIRD